MDAQSVPKTLNQEFQKKPEEQFDPSESPLNSRQDQQNPEQDNQSTVPQQPLQNGGQYLHVAPEKPPEIAEPVSSAVESAAAPLGEGQIQVQHQQNAYYLQNVVNGDQQNLGGDQQNAGLPGLNPAAAAAVAALSQLTQFAGNMVDVERAMVELQGFIAAGGLGAIGSGAVADQFIGQWPMNYGNFPIGQPPFRGGGRRGGDRYRRGGRGNLGNRGRGQWTPRRVSQQGSSYAHPGNSASEVAKSVEEVAGPSTVKSDKAVQAGMSHQESVPATVTLAPEHSRVVRCELCKVNCNTMEVLEQHRNGKKHKKNMEKFGVQESYQPVTTIQSNGEDVTASNPEGKSQVMYMHNGEENKLIVPGEIPLEALTDNTGSEHKQIQSNQSQNLEAEQSYMQSQPGIHQLDNQKIGMKRKMRGGRGGKRMKTFDAPRRPKDPNKPKVAVPLICDLCNVKCDTQEVFDRHLSGKKHISKYKRFQSHQAMYGPVGLQVLYPPNPTQTLNQPQDHQQALSAQPSSILPPGAYSAAQVYAAEPPNQVTGGN